MAAQHLLMASCTESYLSGALKILFLMSLRAAICQLLTERVCANILSKMGKLAANRKGVC